MGKKTFIAGGKSLSERLIREMKNLEYSVFLAVPQKESKGGDKKQKEPGYSWNPRSPISTRALITEAVRNLEYIDDTLLVFSPPGLQDPFLELSARAIETSIDNYLKGPIFLIREVLNVMKRQGSGNIYYIITPAPSSEEHPLDLAIRKALISFINSLFSGWQDDQIIMHGFQAVDLEEETYTEMIVQAVTGKQKNYQGRWHKLGTGQGLLSSLPFTGRKK